MQTTKIEDKHELQWRVYNLIENISKEVLIGLGSSDIIVKLDNGKRIKIKFEEMGK